MADNQEANAVMEPGAPVEAQSNGRLWYWRQAVEIARFDSAAIARISRDPAALYHGLGILMISAGAPALLLPSTRPDGASASIVMLGSLVSSVATTALMHGAAKLLFGTTGTFVGLLRVLWLGSIVGLIGVVPVVGIIVAGVWSLLISMVTFQEVDGIERLQALGLSVGMVALSIGVARMIG